MHDSDVGADTSRLKLAEQTEADAIAYFNSWPAIPLDGLAGPLSRALDSPEANEIAARQRYADALTDLQRLLDEVRFGACVSYMLLRDFAVRHQAAETTPPKGPPAIPVEALALLAGHIPPTGPSLLLKDLHAEISGSRHLSRWLAGQLLDSALVRAVSALDRLAALVSLAAAAPKLNRRGEWFAPTLSEASLADVATYYRGAAAWDELMELSSDEATVWVREQVRNAFIHRRRWPSALTSEAVAVYSHFDKAGNYVRDERAGLTAPQHLALVRMTWEKILSPATELVDQLLAGKPTE